jgi:glycosidase
LSGLACLPGVLSLIAAAPEAPTAGTVTATLHPLSRDRLGQDVSFLHRPQAPTTQEVCLVGEFNDWELGATPLEGPDRGGAFRTSLRLPPGRHLYKFVEDGTRYVEDRRAIAFEPDGYGGRNAVIEVAVPPLPAATVGDGEFDAARIVHNLGRAACLPHLDNRVELRLVTRAHDVGVVRATWIGGPATDLIPLGDEGEESLWAGELPPPPGRAEYRFEVEDGGRTLYVGADGCGMAPDLVGFFAASQRRSASLPPGWVRDAVFYQIFPERFANGDLDNDPTPTDPWGSVPGYYSYQGGDLRGITEHLDYLAELGVDALYLNPIFLSPSNHKYDTSDYLHVDPHLGGDVAFDDLLSALSARGIRLLLDGVFNHTGNLHPAFRNLRQQGASSPYADWYLAREFPIAAPETPNYAAWNGHGHLPELRTWNPKVREYLYEVGRYWIQRGIDGWRLDAADEVEHGFWRGFRREVRAAGARSNKVPYLLGEIWGNGAPWLAGDQFDGVTNYRLRAACVDFFAREATDAAAFACTLQSLLRSQPKAITEAMVNFVGTHDTPRWRTVCKGRAQRAQLGLLFLVTWPGAPLIYYGDEVGVTGGADPENRTAFDWSGHTWDRHQQELLSRAIRLRHATCALRDGLVAIPFAEAGGGLLYMERGGHPVGAGVVVNRGPARANLAFKSSLADGRWIDAMTGIPARVQGGILSIARVDADQLLLLLPRPLEPLQEKTP